MKKINFIRIINYKLFIISIFTFINCAGSKKNHIKKEKFIEFLQGNRGSRYKNLKSDFEKYIKSEKSDSNSNEYLEEFLESQSYNEDFIQKLKSDIVLDKLSLEKFISEKRKQEDHIKLILNDYINNERFEWTNLKAEINKKVKRPILNNGTKTNIKIKVPRQNSKAFSKRNFNFLELNLSKKKKPFKSRLTGLKQSSKNENKIKKLTKSNHRNTFKVEKKIIALTDLHQLFYCQNKFDISDITRYIESDKNLANKGIKNIINNFSETKNVSCMAIYFAIFIDFFKINDYSKQFHLYKKFESFIKNNFDNKTFEDIDSYKNYFKKDKIQFGDILFTENHFIVCAGNDKFYSLWFRNNRKLEIIKIEELFNDLIGSDPTRKGFEIKSHIKNGIQNLFFNFAKELQNK